VYDQSIEQNSRYGISISPAPQLSIPNSDRGERRAFTFFLHQAAPVLSGALDSDFWASLIPQLSQSEPMIWNAVLAISSLYEHPHVSPYPVELVGVLPVVDPHHHQALKWYNKAISRFKIHIQQNPHDSSLALLSCILFICIEFQQDNIANALALLGQGFKLLSSTPAATEALHNHSTIRDIVAPLFARHAVLASTFGTSDWLSRVDNRMLQSSLAFSTLRDARSALYTLMEHGHAFIRMAGMRIKNQHAIADLIPLRDTLLSKLMEWNSTFMALDCKASTLEICASSNLLMYHGVAVIWASTHLGLVQTAFDQHNDRFEEIVHHADIILTLSDTQPSFTFEMGVIPPLYFVATKCRHPTIRRKALALLRKAPDRESSWRALPTAKVVEKVIALEERHQGRFVEFPPAEPVVWVDESKRIRHLEVLQESSPSGTPQFMIKTARYFDDLHGERELEQDVASL
jgi:hypothetical protein